MNKIALLSLFAVSSLVLPISAARADESDFERGYEAGKATCAATPITQLWLCSLEGNYTVEEERIDTSSTGRTRAEALSNLSADILRRATRINCATI